LCSAQLADPSLEMAVGFDGFFDNVRRPGNKQGGGPVKEDKPPI
jgi:hypothetical protein